jgi:hypothetical protein
MKLPSRLLGAPDEASTNALQRGGLSPENARRYLLRQVDSGAGKEFSNLVGQHQAARWFQPIARTATSALERGLERTPGIGGRASIRKWTNATPEVAKRRQILGALAMLGGLGAGAATDDLSPGQEALFRLASAGLGPFVAPFNATVDVGRNLARGERAGGVARGLFRGAMNQVPLPREMSLQQFLADLLPYGGLGEMVSPADPYSFDMRNPEGRPSLFAPTVRQVPIVNDLLLDRRRGAR